MLLNISYLLQMIQKMNAYIEFELWGCPPVCCKNIEMDKKIYIYISIINFRRYTHTYRDASDWRMQESWRVLTYTS